MISNEVKKYIDKSVLCWLATVDQNNIPNVSPKEMFTYQDETTLLVANIASPNTVNNIRQNPNVCVSFIDVFIQKGYKLTGTARIIEKKDKAFQPALNQLKNIFSDEFPVQGIIKIKVTETVQIIAPSYYLFPETTEQAQIKSAMKTYKVQPA